MYHSLQRRNKIRITPAIVCRSIYVLSLARSETLNAIVAIVIATSYTHPFTFSAVLT